MDDPMIETGPAIDLDRRALLRRGAVVLGATALWTTPVVQTLGMRAAAAGTDPTDAVLCPEGAGAPSNLVFGYEAVAATPANIEIHRPRGPEPGTWCAEVLPGQTFQVPRKANPEMAFTIMTGESTELLTLHTSCSQELAIGLKFGSLRLVGGLNSDGDRVGTTVADRMAVLGKCSPVSSTENDGAEDLGEDDAEVEKAATEKEQAEAAAEQEREQAEAAAEKEKAAADKQEVAAEKEKADKAAAEQEKTEAEKAEIENGKEAEKSISE